MNHLVNSQCKQVKNKVMKTFLRFYVSGIKMNEYNLKLLAYNMLFLFYNDLAKI